MRYYSPSPRSADYVPFRSLGRAPEQPEWNAKVRKAGVWILGIGTVAALWWTWTKANEA